LYDLSVGQTGLSILKMKVRLTAAKPSVIKFMAMCCMGLATGVTRLGDFLPIGLLLEARCDFFEKMK
jgi:hypothetical protein